MVIIRESKSFSNFYSKLKDSFLKQKIEKQIKKIIDNPEIGKPMKNVRKGTREVYIKPFRLSYAYSKEENKITLLDFYHKKNQ